MWKRYENSVMVHPARWCLGIGAIIALMGTCTDLLLTPHHGKGRDIAIPVLYGVIFGVPLYFGARLRGATRGESAPYGPK